jgi:diguanylate cyclase (GGDEF)-like protein
MKTMVRGTRHEQRSVGRQSWILGLAAIALMVGAFVARSRSQQSSERATTNSATVDVVRLLDARGRAGSAFLAEQNSEVLFALGTISSTKRADVTAQRVRTHAVVMDELRRLADGEGPVATESTQLIAEYTRLDLIDAGVLKPDVLSEAAAVSRTGGVTGAPTQSIKAVEALSSAAGLPELVMFDMTAAIYTTEKPVVNEQWTEFFSNAEPYIKNTAGWLGTSELTPTEGSRFDLTAADQLLPEQAAQVNELLRPIWPMDRWRTSWNTAPPGAPPMAFADFVDMTDKTVTVMKDWRAQFLADRQTTAQHIATEAQRESDRLVLAAVALFAGAFVTAAAAMGTIVKRSRTSRRITQQAFTDGLTGVGNRYALYDEVTHLVSDSQFVSHLVAIADMDRFKMINDTWGHSAGDRALVETASRLQALVGAVTKLLPGSQGSVVRLGGDEFLFSLHSKTVIDQSAVRAHLDALLQPTMDLGEGCIVPLELSVGIATSDGTATLSDLMTAADLEVYNNKSRRADARQARSATTPSTQELSSNYPVAACAARSLTNSATHCRPSQ